MMMLLKMQKNKTAAPQMTDRATDQVARDSAYQVFKKVLEGKITFVSIDYRVVKQVFRLQSMM
ncbi:hypothetical protein [Paenibacillus polymyxa]|uniref:Uncharacterized protein n=1 Tax=Paenibacillus polymyxa TaxID=1406 RepID=A0AAE9L7T6_PAEPO|nr:hypothetical protein [Paenibacillus polymyxa]URJ51918.1 hypothetical protein MF626_001381 [Paenibacillus polymyxa]